MKRFFSETPEERRKERDETFCIRVVELSILATTLCGVMISFSYQADPAALFMFLLSSSCFIASGMGLILLILVGRGYFTESLPRDIMEKLRGWAVVVFLCGMLNFFFGISFMAAFNIVFYVFISIPLFIVGIVFVCYFHKYARKSSKRNK